MSMHVLVVLLLVGGGGRRGGDDMTLTCIRKWGIAIDKHMYMYKEMGIDKHYTFTQR